MNDRFLKQLIYLLIFLSPFLIFVFLKTYTVLKPEPTCFDNIKNQGEEDVDCGGPCPPCEIKNLDPLIKYPVKFVKYPDESIDVFAKVFNPNKEWSLKELEYSFKFYDKNNKLVFQTEKKKIPLGNNETKYIVEQNLKIPYFEKIELELIIDPFKWIKEQKIKPDLIYYEPKIIKNNLNQNILKFSVFNKSIYDYPNIEGLVFLYNENKEILGIIKFNLEIKEKELKEINLIVPFNIEPKSVEIYFQN
ncbi:MAG: hypothetical protein C4348_02790 [Patescibacteria group bacterium]